MFFVSCVNVFVLSRRQTIGIPLEDQLNLFNTLGAVLNLGNLLFEPLTGDSEASAVCETCGAILQAVAAFLHLPSASLLEKALTYRTIVAAGDTYTWVNVLKHYCR